MSEESSVKRAVQLREVEKDDRPIFFEQQLDAEANHMAAFTSKHPGDRDAFNAHWIKILGDSSIIIRTILYKGKVAGHVLKYEMSARPEVSYWLGKEFWGQGIATQALSLFLDELITRPIYARSAKDNLASMRVLEKCGFMLAGNDKGFANARGEEIEEVVMQLG